MMKVVDVHAPPKWYKVISFFQCSPVIAYHTFGSLGALRPHNRSVKRRSASWRSCTPSLINRLAHKPFPRTFDRLGATSATPFTDRSDDKLYNAFVAWESNYLAVCSRFYVSI